MNQVLLVTALVTLQFVAKLWGWIDGGDTSPLTLNWPITISILYAISGNDYGENSMCILSFPAYTPSTITISGYRIRSGKVDSPQSAYGRYIAICK